MSTDRQAEQCGDGVRRNPDQRPAPRRNPEVAERYLAEMRTRFGNRSDTPKDGGPRR